jgi:hypothetical protein
MVDGKAVAALLRQQVDLLRVEAGTRGEVLRMLNGLLRELIGELAGHDLTAFSKARTQQLIVAARGAIDSAYGRVSDRVDAVLGGVADVQAAQAAKLLERILAVVDVSAGLPSATYLERAAGNTLVQGAPSADWWARQAEDTALRFADVVRHGIAAGDTTEGIAARVAGRRGYPGIMEVARQNARSLVHTSIQEVANEARKETFRQNDDVVEGVRQVSTLDSSTTEICIAYDGAEFDLDGEPINGTTLPYEGGTPRHWGCRSVEVPITKTFKELGIDLPEPEGGTRASADGPVPASMTFEEFLGQHTAAEQDEMLGQGRAELWREGKITLQQLLDQRGNPLTVEELREKYG